MIQRFPEGFSIVHGNIVTIMGISLPPRDPNDDDDDEDEDDEDEDEDEPAVIREPDEDE